MMSSDPSSSRTHSLLDRHSMAEVARLLHHSRLLNEVMGGLMPEQDDLSAFGEVLDLGCGPGLWAVDMAALYPEMQVLAVDPSVQMLDYARLLARGQGLDNLSFGHMNLSQPLDLTDQSRDLVSGRLLSGLLTRHSWPFLVGESVRVLRPKGVLRLTEWECCVSNSPSLQRWVDWLHEAMARQGRTAWDGGHARGITSMLGKLMRDAGVERIAERPFLLNASYDSPHYYACFQEMQQVGELLKPVVVGLGLMKEAAYEDSMQQIILEMLHEQFVCHCFGVTVWGIKPSLLSK